MRYKKPVIYIKGYEPYCPCCGSPGFMRNDHGLANNFCGQCGTPLDWKDKEVLTEDDEECNE